MPFTPPGSQRAIETGLLSGNIYVGLHTANPTSGNEISGTSYERLLISTGDWTFAETASSGRARNAAIEAFTSPGGDWTDPTHVGIWSALTGGTLWAYDSLASDVAQPRSGDTVRFSANALTISVPGTSTAAWTPEASRRALEEGVLSGTVHARLHTASPTTGNEVSGTDYAALAIATGDWTFSTTTSSGRARNTGTESFPTPGGDWTTPTHCGLWTASTGGEVLVRVLLSSTVNQPRSGDTVEFAGNGLVVSIPASTP